MGEILKTLKRLKHRLVDVLLGPISVHDSSMPLPKNRRFIEWKLDPIYVTEALQQLFQTHVLEGVK